VFEIERFSNERGVFFYPRIDYLLDPATLIVMRKSSEYSLKDKIFNQNTIADLGLRLQAVYPCFDQEALLLAAEQNLPKLQLKERIHFLATTLHSLLPKDYLIGKDLLLASLPPELDPQGHDNDFGDFIFTCYAHYIALYGCTSEYVTISLEALTTITKRFSTEFAIRRFLNEFPIETTKFLLNCSQDENYHVRRLASEGTRPKLPWGEKINIAPEEALPILNHLAADPTRFVTRSVANHLNDLSKFDPLLVVETLAQWRARDLNTAAERGYIAKHALRTLLKNGHEPTLQFLGYSSCVVFSQASLSLSHSQLEIGDHLKLVLRLKGGNANKLIIHCVIYYADQSGKPTRRKVYQWKQVTLDKDEDLWLEKTLPFRPMSTRSLYSGLHMASVQINGVESLSKEFTLSLH